MQTIQTMLSIMIKFLFNPITGHNQLLNHIHSARDFCSMHNIRACKPVSVDQINHHTSVVLERCVFGNKSFPWPGAAHFCSEFHFQSNAPSQSLRQGWRSSRDSLCAGLTCSDSVHHDLDRSDWSRKPRTPRRENCTIGSRSLLAISGMARGLYCC